MQTIGGRPPLHGELGQLLRRDREPAQDPRRAADPARRRAARLHGRRPRPHARVLEEVDVAADAEDRLLREGFVYEMLLAHELQHQETMLQLLQLVDGYELPLPIGTAPVAPTARRRSAFPAGTYEIGAPAARLRLRQRAPPPRGRARRLRDRSNPGHQRRVHRGSWRRPAPSRRCTGSATARRLGRRRAGPPRPDRARPPGRPRLLGGGRRFRPLGRQRLPTEFEWEAAARRSSTASARPGNGPPPSSAPTPASPPSPTRSTPQVFFGDEYRVLRGHSWATHPRVARPSFRNWDLPQRRQIFAGLRLAGDA